MRLDRPALASVLIAAVVALSVACGGSSKQAGTPTSVAQTPTAAATSVPTPVACPTTPARPLAVVTPSASGLIATLTDVQVTTQPCLDRIAFSFSGDTLPGYDVRYVQNHTTCGSGEPVYTAGPAQIVVRFSPANAHNDAGNSTIPAQSFLPAYPSIKELRLTCDFEAVTTWAIGAEERYYTVTTSQSPAQIVVDVYH
jgi:hypothetical protein